MSLMGRMRSGCLDGAYEDVFRDLWLLCLVADTSQVVMKPRIE